jgi:hypothetical protein
MDFLEAKGFRDEVVFAGAEEIRNVSRARKQERVLDVRTLGILFSWRLDGNSDLDWFDPGDRFSCG